MKWHSKGRPTEVRPFLVLPLLEAERSASADSSMPTETIVTQSQIPCLATMSTSRTGTWPPKLKLKFKKRDATNNKKSTGSDNSVQLERPLTATLERPELLNINLLDKLDMSLVRKEFLCITNLCKNTVSVSLIAKTPAVRRTLGTRSRQSTTSSSAVSVYRQTPSNVTNHNNNSEVNKRVRKPETSEDSLESDENCSVRRSRRKMSKINKLASKPLKVSKKANDANNNGDSSED